MSDEDLTKLIDSNAKAIQALTNLVNEEKKEKNQLYQYLARIASAQSTFYEVQSDYYNQLGNFQEQLTNQQEQIVKLQEQIVNQQGQIIKILDRLSIKEDDKN